MICDILRELINKSLNDGIVCGVVISLILFSFLISVKFSVLIGILILSSFLGGCVATTVLLRNKEKIVDLIKNVKFFFGFKDTLFDETVKECHVCGDLNCPREQNHEDRDAWKSLQIDKALDESVEKFYGTILDNFIVSWLSEFSQDPAFVDFLKAALREATARLIVKIKNINTPLLITEKLLPCVFAHYELVNKMLDTNIPLDKLATTFIANENPIHPAAFSRQAEINYLRGIAKFLIPSLLRSDIYASKICFSLIREMLTVWVLLPLLDVIADPHLINLLVVIAAEAINDKEPSKIYADEEKVYFLEKFATSTQAGNKNEEDERIEQFDFLKDTNNLYKFMQFLKSEDAVDMLQFHLEVDNLIKETKDPKAATDAAKLSALDLQSEKLLQNYHAMIKNEKEAAQITTLSEAHYHVKKVLHTKWRTSFYKTRDFFEQQYGNRDLLVVGGDRFNPNAGPVAKISTKLKSAIRGGGIDSATIEATEQPTVWDGGSEPSILVQTHFIRNRREKEQSMDAFMAVFMQSVEQSLDMGEDVIEMPKPEPHIPGKNLTFGNLFDLKSTSPHPTVSTHSCYSIRCGPSQCLIYILVQILRAPLILIRFVLAFICISTQSVDTLICTLIDKALRFGLYEPRLAHLIDLLTEVLFVNRPPEPTAEELLTRQKSARDTIESLRGGLGKVCDMLQSPALNKHLMYCLFDLILAEIFPELQQKL